MKKISTTVKLAVFLGILFLFSVFANLYTEWLWFKSVDYQNVFLIVLTNKVIFYSTFFLIGFLLFFSNLLIARRNLEKEDGRPRQTEEEREIIYLDRSDSPWNRFIQGPLSRWIFLGVSLLGALIVASASADNWLVLQQYLNRVTVGIADPVFSKDLGFYFFNLAFYRFIYNTFMMVLVLVAITVGIVYMMNVSFDLFFGDWQQLTAAKSHLAVLLAAIFILKAWGYKLASYEILFSPSGIVYGATYTDIFAKLLSYKALLVLSLIVAAVILANIFVKRLKWILYSIGAWVVAAVVLGGIYPATMQKLVVQPNEFNREKPYIENAIEFTRKAYALDRAENKTFEVDYDLDINDPENLSTVENIRLWDWKPLQTTFRNLQQLRGYYVFNDVDIDRYVIDGKYRQVMLSARELEQDGLSEDAKTWINQRLMYTHGYGVVVSPVNEVSEEGFPNFFIKDVPPRFTTDLTLKRPEIYFGEGTDYYVIVNTKQKEFDYPMGEKNVYSLYEGENGIKINSFFRRFLLSWTLKDYKLLLASDITNESQILINRNIMQRIQKVAPYLKYDSDPYIVINEDGKLYWILDAYTFSDKYPYSEPFDNRGNNYLCNSVKVICDAYTGEMSFYIADASDPIIKTYNKIFPDIYKPLSDMPSGLQDHIRYPVDMFSIQAGMYKNFHMTDPYVFYNKEDPWLVPKEIVEDKLQEMEPYYIIMRLPDEEKAEYVLMLPFTPKNRPNMVAWMCARMDGDNYGKMLVYSFSKQETIYGPEQIESRINQDTTISQQLSLWDQRGSRVYRGNLLVIPIKNSILYVEPLYLQAENSKLPELKRVIAGFGNRIVMEPSLDKALIKLFGEGIARPDQPDTGEPSIPGADNRSIGELARQARQYYDRANQLLREGDWAGYGENIEKLNQVIKKLEETASQ